MSIVYDSWLLLLLSNDKDYDYDGYDYYPKQKNDDRRMIFFFVVLCIYSFVIVINIIVIFLLLYRWVFVLYFPKNPDHSDSSGLNSCVCVFFFIQFNQNKLMCLVFFPALIVWMNDFKLMNSIDLLMVFDWLIDWCVNQRKTKTKTSTSKC